MPGIENMESSREPRPPRPEAARFTNNGTDELLDEIIDILQTITGDIHEQSDKSPELAPALLLHQKRLNDLTFRVFALKNEARGRGPLRSLVDKAKGRSDYGPMNDRLTAVEKDLASLKTDVAIIRSNYVTKEDLHRELHSATWKLIGANAALIAAVFFIARATVDVHVAAPQAQVAPSTASAPTQQAPAPAKP